MFLPSLFLIALGRIGRKKGWGSVEEGYPAFAWQWKEKQEAGDSPLADSDSQIRVSQPWHYWLFGQKVLCHGRGMVVVVGSLSSASVNPWPLPTGYQLSLYSVVTKPVKSPGGKSPRTPLPWQFTGGKSFTEHLLSIQHLGPEGFMIWVGRLAQERANLLSPLEDSNSHLRVLVYIHPLVIRFLFLPSYLPLHNTVHKYGLVKLSHNTLSSSLPSSEIL